MVYSCRLDMYIFINSSSFKTHGLRLKIKILLQPPIVSFLFYYCDTSAVNCVNRNHMGCFHVGQLPVYLLDSQEHQTVFAYITMITTQCQRLVAQLKTSGEKQQLVLGQIATAVCTNGYEKKIPSGLLNLSKLIRKLTSSSGLKINNFNVMV